MEMMGGSSNSGSSRSSGRLNETEERGIDGERILLNKRRRGRGRGEV